MPALKPVLASLLIGTATVPSIGLAGAKAQTVSQPGYSRTTQCFRDEYREEYIPGTKDSPGYVRNWTEKVEIACANKPNQIPTQETQAVDVDNNSCVEGSVIGGLLGAGLGAALSRKEGRWVGVPVGAAAGAVVGCQVDGG
ncbi:glycine zipper 2TM domain-containing protein [Synechococcus sp. MU1651]|uniref:glycine zipper 2TM domain-containing protein n=1 Tax=Synechococcus sp. MU1651 TaxID=2508353 RepID=UPI0020267CCF|nr:glycine zipper 2TM domain-containing protein [Synechococcus sp. MU1651]